MRLRLSISITLSTLLLSPFATFGQLADPIPEPITASDIDIGVEQVASDLTAPNSLTHAGDGSGRLFVSDQIGQIRLIDPDSGLQPTPFLDVSQNLVDLNPGFDERGLLGVAFHPEFAEPGSAGYGRFYTYTSEPADNQAPDFAAPLPAGADADHHSVIREWTMDDTGSDVFDGGSSRELMRIEQPQFNHDGGDLAFGPDGHLYISLGDGGAADDQGPGHSVQGNGQDKSNILGSIARIDPLGSNSANGQYGIPATNPFVGDGDDAVDEIFAYGLRNPFRFSFDRDSGDLIIGDVGQNDIEEVNRIDPDVDNNGVNFGWRVKEGTFLFDDNGNGSGFVTADSVGSPATLNGDPVVDPVAQYDHDEGISVIGGFVYNGSAVPQLDGLYVFGDFALFGQEGPGGIGDSGRLFVADLDQLDPVTGLATIEELLPGDQRLGLTILGFGEDQDGELYILANGVDQATTGSSGVVLRIVPEPTAAALLTLGGAAILGRPRRRH